MPKDLTNIWRVGQQVWWQQYASRRDSAMTEGVVVKLGRKLMTVHAVDASRHPIDYIFRMDSGHENHSYSPPRLWTTEELCERDERAAALATLKKFGLEVNWLGHSVEMDLAKLQAMAAIVEDRDD